MSPATSHCTITMGTDIDQHSTNITTSVPNFTKDPLTDFLKRHNWQQRILETIPDFLYVLALDGKILYASASCVSITGYQSTQLTGRSIGAFIHPDDTDVFVKEMDDSITTGNPLRLYHRFRKADGDWIVFESHGHAHSSKKPAPSSVRVDIIYDAAFFITSRPYLTKSAALIDSFLEHKTENERLTNRLKELRDEVQENSEPQAWEEKSAEEEALMLGSNETFASDKSGKSKTPVSRSSEQVQDVKSRHTSRVGDLGIRFFLYSDWRISSKTTKKKRTNAISSYVCLSCGTSDSPEWRRGPNGSKTLCNACGCKLVLSRKHATTTKYDSALGEEPKEREN